MNQTTQIILPWLNSLAGGGGGIAASWLFDQFRAAYRQDAITTPKWLNTTLYAPRYARIVVLILGALISVIASIVIAILTTGDWPGALDAAFATALSAAGSQLWHARTLETRPPKEPPPPLTVTDGNLSALFDLERRSGGTVKVFCQTMGNSVMNRVAWVEFLTPNGVRRFDRGDTIDLSETPPPPPIPANFRQEPPNVLRGELPMIQRERYVSPLEGVDHGIEVPDDGAERRRMMGEHVGKYPGPERRLGSRAPENREERSE